MSFTNKFNGRGEYLARSNSNPNKIQAMNYRNSLTNSHTNGNNGETYLYDEKSQHTSNSAKIVTESHVMSQHISSPRDSYIYKNNNSRAKQYHTNKNYNDKHVNYYCQNSTSPTNVIPGIEQLREFVKEQTEHFKMELTRHESHKSNSPSPSSYQYNDQNNYKYNKSYGSLNRSLNGFPMSHSAGSIPNNNSGAATITMLTVSPTCSENSNRHQDVRLISQQNSFTVIKNNNGYNNYSKYTPSSQSSSKQSPGLVRNISYDESSKSPNIMKTRNDSPINNHQIMDKNINKNQMTSPIGSSGGVVRQDIKKTYNRSGKPNQYATGTNLSIHQQNQNNSAANDCWKNDQQYAATRPMINSVVRNIGVPPKLNNNRRGYSARYDNSDGGAESEHVYRTVVSVETYPGKRSLQNHNNIICGQDIADSHPPEQFLTSELSGSSESNDIVAQQLQIHQH